MGRPKGSVNRPKRALIRRLQEDYPGYEPVVEMARAAHKLTATVNMLDSLLSRVAITRPEAADQLVRAWSDVVDAHGKVAKFVTPQLKAIEHTVEAGPKTIKKITRQIVDARTIRDRSPD